jgi:hypothetical protein
MTDSFWPTGLDLNNPRTPVSLMKEQADQLTQLTDGKLIGEVFTHQRGPTIVTELNIRVPYINNYRITILEYWHDVKMFPGKLIDNFGAEEADEVTDEVSFIKAMKDVLGSATTKTILENLISQANAA